MATWYVMQGIVWTSSRPSRRGMSTNARYFYRSKFCLRTATGEFFPASDETRAASTRHTEVEEQGRWFQCISHEEKSGGRNIHKLGGGDEKRCAARLQA
jgi:hypothetical protein